MTALTEDLKRILAAAEKRNYDQRQAHIKTMEVTEAMRRQIRQPPTVHADVKFMHIEVPMGHSVMTYHQALEFLGDFEKALDVMDKDMLNV